MRTNACATTDGREREMNAEQREQARHALGLDGERKVSYRNRYVCAEDDANWQDLVQRCLATFRPAATVPFVST